MHLRIFSSATFLKCVWMRWCIQWDAPPFPGLCASCSSKLRNSIFLEKHKAQLYCFQNSLDDLHGIQKVLQSCCSRETQNVRRDWGFCVPITIILSDSAWEGRCCFRNNLWFLNNLWAYISEQEIGSRHKLSLADLIYMQQKYHLQLSWDWPVLNMPSLITCVAYSSVLIAHIVSPRSLAGEGCTEHVVP